MKLIEEWRRAWRLWSIQLAAVAAAIAAALVANPSFVLSLINLVPEGWRPVAALVTGLLTFIVPAFARLVRQPERKGEGEP